MKPGLLIRTVVVLSVAGLMLPAQTATDEGRYGVPELEAFHEVIYPIWHTAYPQKDLAALRGYVPEVEKLALAVEQAKLPGILMEQKEDWDKALIEFRKTVDAYKQAAAGEDGPALLAAAEGLHSAYEMLNRVVWPLPREVMAFHESLYVVFHTHLPGKDYSAVRAAGPELLAKAEAVAKAKLSRRFESKAGLFQPAAAALLDSVKALTAVAAGDDVALGKAAIKMHDKYADLVRVFE